MISRIEGLEQDFYNKISRTRFQEQVKYILKQSFHTRIFGTTPLKEVKKYDTFYNIISRINFSQCK